MTANAEPSRLHFDTTIDEMVDVHARSARRTKEYFHQRRIQQWAIGGTAAVAALFVLMRDRCECMTRTQFLSAGAVAVIAGIILGYLGGPWYDAYAKRHWKRLIRESCHGDESIACEMELGPDSLRCKSKYSEMALPWTTLTSVEDSGDAIELWFDPGLAVLRNHVFASASERSAWLENAKKFVRRP